MTTFSSHTCLYVNICIFYWENDHINTCNYCINTCLMLFYIYIIPCQLNQRSPAQILDFAYIFLKKDKHV